MSRGDVFRSSLAQETPDAIAIRLTDVSRGLAVYLVNYFGRALYGPQAVSERVSERVDDIGVIFDSTNNDTDVIVT